MFTHARMSHTAYFISSYPTNDNLGKLLKSHFSGPQTYFCAVTLTYSSLSLLSYNYLIYHFIVPYLLHLRDTRVRATYHECARGSSGTQGASRAAS